VPEDKKEKLLAKAKEVIARKGYASASIKEIADKAGVAQGTPYLYFKNKEDMFIKLLVTFENDIDANIKRALNMDADFWGKIEYIIKSMAELFNKDRMMMNILKREMPEPLGIGKKGLRKIEEIHKNREKKMHKIFSDIKGNMEFNTSFSEKDIKRICMMVVFGMMKRLEHGEESEPAAAADLAIKSLKEILAKR